MLMMIQSLPLVFSVPVGVSQHGMMSCARLTLYQLLFDCSFHKPVKLNKICSPNSLDKPETRSRHECHCKESAWHKGRSKE